MGKAWKDNNDKLKRNRRVSFKDGIPLAVSLQTYTHIQQWLFPFIFTAMPIGMWPFTKHSLRHVSMLRFLEDAAAPRFSFAVRSPFQMNSHLFLLQTDAPSAFRCFPELPYRHYWALYGVLHRILHCASHCVL